MFWPKFERRANLILKKYGLIPAVSIGEITLLFRFSLAFTFLGPTLFISIFRDLDASEPVYAGILACGLLLTHLSLALRGQTLRLTKFDVSDLLLLLGLLSLFLSLTSLDEPLRPLGSFSLIISAFYIYYLARFGVSSKVDYEFLLLIFVLKALLISIQGLPLFIFPQKEGLLAKHIFYGSRNVTAIALLSSFFLSLELIRRGGSSFVLDFARISIVSCAAYFFLSRCRAVWLALIFIAALSTGKIILGYRSKKVGQLKLKLTSLFGLMPLVGGIALLFFYYSDSNLSEKIGTAVRTFESPGEGSAGGRLDIWLNGLAMIRDHFIRGVGFENWWGVFPLYKNHSVITSYQFTGPLNTWLELLGENGALCGIPWLAFLVATYLRSNKKGRAIAYGLAALLIAASFHSLSSMSFFFPDVALLCGLMRRFEQESEKTSWTPSWFKYHLAVGMVILLVLGVQFRFSQSDVYHESLKNALRYGPNVALEISQVKRALLPRPSPIDGADLVSRIEEAEMRKLAALGNYDQASTSFLISEMFLRLEEYQRSMIWIERAIAERPNDPICQLFYCRLLQRIGKNSEAAAACEKAISIDPYIPEVAFELFEINRAQGDAERAASFLRKAKDVATLRISQHQNHEAERVAVKRWARILSTNYP